jgi:glycosyltransferase involved in cell wall biosynthesis
MKVLHITNNYPTKEHPIFGIFVKEQIDSLNDIGIDCEVFFINGKEKGKFEYFRCIPELKRIIKSNSFDLIHCHHAFSAVVAVLFTRLNKKLPIVISFQNDPANEAKFNLFNLLATRSSAWIFKNNSVFAVPPKGHYLPNGVNMDFFKPISREESCRKLNLNPEKRYVLFVSSNNVRKQKRYDRFCAVLDTMRKKYKLTDIEELTMINVERELVPYYFGAASLHLLTSDFEGSPNSVKEAMACNLPVVSTNVGNVNELLNGVNGSYIAESNEIEELTVKSIKALENADCNSREMLLSKNLDIKSVAYKLKEIYSEL